MNLRSIFLLSGTLLLVVSVCGAVFLYEKHRTVLRSTTKESDIISSPVVKGNTLPKKEVVATPQNSFIMTGDVMLGRCVAEKYKGNYEKLFEKIGSDFFTSADTTIINFEGSIAPVELSNTCERTFTFLFPRETPSVLKKAGITHAGLANNHSDNGGPEGIDNTTHSLTEAGIVPFGVANGFNATSLVFLEGPVPVVLIGVHTLFSVPLIENDIEALSGAGYIVIVYVHWGDEYKKIHSEQQERLAHTWIDAGASLIVGTHPHVIQDVETYKARPILYSLGNFIFDQDWSRETSTGLMLKGVVTKEGMTITLFPTLSNEYAPEFLSSEEGLFTLLTIKNTWSEESVIDKDNTFFFPF